MNIQRIFSISLFLLTLATAFAQQLPPTIITQRHPPGPSESTTLLNFDLDFPGGTPKELIAAIQKASGRPLNAIVPEEFADTKLPTLKMKNVNVLQLFQALRGAGEKHEDLGPGTLGGQRAYSVYGFRASLEGAVSDDSIWYFYAEKPKNAPQPVPKVCRFYPLARYLESGTTVDDITTAIKTGAKLLGEGTGPDISLHKDTKLLLAVGEPSKLEIIDSVLRAMDSQRPIPSPARSNAPEAPKSEKK